LRSSLKDTAAFAVLIVPRSSLKSCAFCDQRQVDL
jgi:hypothetical protein